jgi:hypothetical protein
MAAKTVASTVQKEDFKKRFAEIIENNLNLKDQYSIQFFETAQKSNYSFTGKDGKSINVLSKLSLEEIERYKILKSSWQD